jgi:hypothetical protein
MAVEVRHERLNKIIEKFRACGKPLFVQGKTGIGKSEAIAENSRAYASKISRVWVEWKKLSKEDKRNLLNNDEAKKFHIFVDIRTALLEPTDLLGLPDGKEQDFVSWKPTLMFRVLSNPDASATVFFDEFNLGSRMVQNASYQVVLDKSIGELCFGNDVFIIAAGNRVEDKANVIETPAPLNDRFGHLVLIEPTIDEWIAYNGRSKTPNAFICSFLKFKPEFIHNFKPNMKEKAFSTPRSLQFLSALIDDLDINREADMDMVRDLASAKCGEIFASNFEAFLKTARKIDIDDILAHPNKVAEFNNKALDMKYAVITGVAYKVKEAFKKNIEPALEVATFLEPEFGIFMVRMIRDLCGVSKFNEHARKSDIWLTKLSGHFKGLLGWD